MARRKPPSLVSTFTRRAMAETGDHKGRPCTIRFGIAS